MKGASGFAVLAIAGSIGFVGLVVRFVGDSGGAVPALRSESSEGHSLSSRLLDRLRVSARRSDADGRAHHELAVALRDLAIRHSATEDDDAVSELLLEGVDAAEVSWGRRPTSSSATVLGDLHGVLASRGGTLAQVRHGRRAAELYARAVQLDPRNPLAHVGVGISMLKTPVLFGGDPERALSEFRKAQLLDPHCTRAWVWEGIALRRAGHVRQARAALAYALTLDPGNQHARTSLDALDQDFPE